MGYYYAGTLSTRGWRCPGVPTLILLVPYADSWFPSLIPPRKSLILLVSYVDYWFSDFLVSYVDSPSENQ
jgi:hypothetical protein